MHPSPQRIRLVPPAGHPPPGAGRQAAFDLEVAAPRLPRDLRPMLPRRAAAPFDSDEHLFDIAWGGHRALVFVDDPAGPPATPPVAIVSAAGAEITPAWRTVALAARMLAGVPLILDGELLAPGRGRGAQKGGASGRVFLAFDLLALEGRLLVGEPLHRRRAMLEAIVRDVSAGRGRAGAGSLLVPLRSEGVAPSDGAPTVPFPGMRGAGDDSGCRPDAPAPIVAAVPVEGDGTGLFRAALAYRLPGIVAKRRDAPYLPGIRSGLWLAIRASRGGHPPVAGEAGGDTAHVAAAVARRRAFNLFLRLPL